MGSNPALVNVFNILNKALNKTVQNTHVNHRLNGSGDKMLHCNLGEVSSNPTITLLLSLNEMKLSNWT